MLLCRHRMYSTCLSTVKESNLSTSSAQPLPLPSLRGQQIRSPASECCKLHYCPRQRVLKRSVGVKRQELGIIVSSWPSRQRFLVGALDYSGSAYQGSARITPRKVKIQQHMVTPGNATFYNVSLCRLSDLPTMDLEFLDMNQIFLMAKLSLDHF